MFLELDGSGRSTPSRRARAQGDPGPDRVGGARICRSHARAGANWIFARNTVLAATNSCAEVVIGKVVRRTRQLRSRPRARNARHCFSASGQAARLRPPCPRVHGTTSFRASVPRLPLQPAVTVCRSPIRPDSHAWRRALAARRHAEVDYPIRGAWPAPARRQSATRPARRRGISAPAETCSVVSARAGVLPRRAGAARRRGHGGAEDPTTRGAHARCSRPTARVAAVEADDEGLVVARLPPRPPRLVVVTPSHQFPLRRGDVGRRRLELLDAAGQSQRCWSDRRTTTDGSFATTRILGPRWKSLDRQSTA